jgi:DNA-binding GntR family transcriptional regulator
MRALAVEIRSAAATSDPVHYLQATRAIHEAEVAAARNSVLAATIGVIHGQSRRFWFAQTQASARPSMSRSSTRSSPATRRRRPRARTACSTISSG